MQDHARINQKEEYTSKRKRSVHPNLLISGFRSHCAIFRTSVTLSKLFAEQVYPALGMLKKNSSECVCVQAARASLTTHPDTHSSSWLFSGGWQTLLFFCLLTGQ